MIPNVVKSNQIRNKTANLRVEKFKSNETSIFYTFKLTFNIKQMDRRRQKREIVCNINDGHIVTLWR